MEIVLLIIALLVSFGITAYGVRRVTPPIERNNRENWRKVVFFFFLMMIGILARELYNALVNKLPFNVTGVVIAALVSPMVFSGIYANLQKKEISLETVVLAFQNGFFWNSIFEGIKTGAQTPTPTPTPAG